MRLFIAVTLDSLTREAVGALIGRLSRHGSFKTASVRWVEAPNLHLTLHFLGKTDTVQVEPLDAALAPAWRQEPFRASLGPLGTFSALGDTPGALAWCRRGKPGAAISSDGG